MSTTPNLGLTLLDPGQNQKEVTINEGLGDLDTILGAIVTANNGKLLSVAAGVTAALGLGAQLVINAGNLEIDYSGNAAEYLDGSGAWSTPAGGGTVTSVALSMPGIFSVSGSPVTTSGTLAVSLASQSANIVLAGPASGSAAAPTFRALVGLDLPLVTTSERGAAPTLSNNATEYLDGTGAWSTPAGGGTVTSVALTMPGIFSVSGSPVTGSGTLAVTLATQSANTVMAGPAVGGAAAPTFRALVGADIPLASAFAQGGIQSLSGTATEFLNGAGNWAVPAGTGISSLGGQTGATQTFAVGTSGTDFAASSSGNVHTFNLPSASATARGVVSTGTQTFAGDKTFSGKLAINGAPTSANRVLSIQGAGASNSDLISFYNNSATEKWHFVLLAHNHLSYAETGVADGRFTIFSGGNIGIGSGTATSVNARFHVTSGGSSSATTAVRIRNSAPTDLFTIRDDGQVSVPIATSSIPFMIGADVGIYRFNTGNIAIRSTSTNSYTTLRLQGNGTGASGILSSFEFFCDDSTSNFGRLILVAGTNLILAADRGGSGTARPLRIRAGTGDWSALSDIAVFESGVLKLPNATSSANAVLFGGDAKVWRSAAGVLETDSQMVVEKRITTGVATLTPGTTVATDASLGNHFRLTAAQNFTLSNPTNPVNGQKIVWEIIQDATGSRTITLDTKFALGTDIAAVTLTTTANARDFLGAVYNSTTDKWYVIAFTKGY